MPTERSARFPDLTLRCQVANPPFGLTWKAPNGIDKCDSTQLTFATMLRRAGTDGCGYMIANRSTIERLKLHETHQVYLYQTFPNGLFPDADVEIGVLHFHGGHESGAAVVNHTSSAPGQVLNAVGGIQRAPYYVNGTPVPEVIEAFRSIRRILIEERRNIPPFNIYLDSRG